MRIQFYEGRRQPRAEEINFGALIAFVQKPQERRDHKRVAQRADSDNEKSRKAFWILDFGFWIENLHDQRIINPKSKIQNPNSRRAEGPIHTSLGQRSRIWERPGWRGESPIHGFRGGPSALSDWGTIVLGCCPRLVWSASSALSVLVIETSGGSQPVVIWPSGGHRNQKSITRIRGSSQCSHTFSLSLN